MRRFALFVACLATFAQFVPSAETTPERARSKYGPAATRLFAARDYVRHHEAPDFWALVPYYSAQHTENACSVAAVVMLVNGLRARQDLRADDELATAEGVLNCVDTGRWRDKISQDGTGVSLDEIAALLPDVLKSYGVSAEVRVERFDGEQKESLRALRSLLSTNECTDDDLILVNFLQSEATADPEGAVGHFAPVAAYDAAKDRVLIFDPDRRWYEPYWISTETLLAAMAAKDETSARPRGLLVVKRTDEG